MSVTRKEAKTKKTRAKKFAGGMRSRMVHGPSDTRSWQFSKHLIPPITSNTTYRLDSLQRGAKGFQQFAADHQGGDEPILIYDRLDEPNTLMLEEQLALIEGAGCAVTFSSGMGAISSTLLSLLQSGDRILAHRNLYGCTYSLMSEWLPRFGIQTKFVDINDSGRIQELADDRFRVVYFECLSNPNLDLADLPAIVRDVQKINQTRAKKSKNSRPIVIVVDNTFATPWALRPIEWGVDMVIHSLTKNMGGFGVEMGGAVMGAHRFEKSLKMARKDFGAILNPKSAWHVSVHGLPTLAIRFERQQANAIRVAEFLEEHPKVESVLYPGLDSYSQRSLAKRLLRTPEGHFAPGTMISFTLKGDLKKCQKFVDHVARHSYSITLAVSLGLTKTLIEVPGFMTHSAIPADQKAASGIDPRAIRLSLGIEDSGDLIRDLETALRLV